MLPISAINAAYDIIHDSVTRTPLEYSERLSTLYEAEIYLKREDLQPVRSYKIRWALNHILSLTSEERSHGVVCASAGNHAQWVAFACHKLGIHGTIFMPKTAPEQKVYKTQKIGGDFVKIVLVGDSFDDASAASREYQKQTGAVYIHPFDTPQVIAGQGTVAREIHEALPDPDYIIAPVGGGGLVAWIISYVVGSGMKSRVIGVEAAGAPSMEQSLSKGVNTTLATVDTFADGVAVKRVGDQTFAIAQEYGLEVFTVPENRVCTTILEYLREDGTVVEPAGAISTDVLQDLRTRIRGKKIVVVVSGGNFDFERLPEVKERSMRWQGTKKYLLVSFAQRPGALREFLDLFGPHEDITRFEYLKKSNKNRAPALVGIESPHPEEFQIFLNRLTQAGIQFQDITDNQMVYDLII